MSGHAPRANSRVVCGAICGRFITIVLVGPSRSLAESPGNYQQHRVVIGVMKRGVTLILVAFAGFLVVVGQGHSASACSCAGFTDKEAFEGADTVFAGTLLEIVTPPGDTYSSADPERFVFDVDQVYKGDALVRQTIVTARDGASCGLEIAGAGPFLVFATTTDSIVTGAGEGELYSNLCGGTRATADDAIPASFGDAQPASPVSTGGDNSFPYWAMPGIIVVVIGVASVVLALRRTRNAGG